MRSRPGEKRNHIGDFAYNLDFERSIFRIRAHDHPLDECPKNSQCLVALSRLSKRNVELCHPVSISFGKPRMKARRSKRYGVGLPDARMPLESERQAADTRCDPPTVTHLGRPNAHCRCPATSPSAEEQAIVLEIRLDRRCQLVRKRHLHRLVLFVSSPGMSVHQVSHVKRKYDLVRARSDF
jgi:hypothetical protein